MRKIYQAFIIGLLLVSSLFAQFDIQRKWVRAAKFSGQDTLPSWFSPSANTERGFGVFKASNDTPYVVVVSRNGGNSLRVLNALDGTDYLQIPLLPGEVNGGALIVNDCGFTEDGWIFFANVKTTLAEPFKVYTLYQDSLGIFHAKTVLNVFSNENNARLGDKITVMGKMEDGTAKIVAMSATSGLAKIFIWSQETDTSFNPVPTEISLSDNATGGSPSVSFLPNGDFIVNYNGTAPKKYTANGQLIGTVPSTIIPTGSNAIKYLNTDEVGNEYYATFAYGTTAEKIYIFRLLGGDPTKAEVIGITESLRQNANGNGTGDVDLFWTDNGPVFYVLSTNNGIGSYKVIAYGTYDVSARYYLDKAIVNWKLSGGDFKISYHDGIATSAFYYVNSRAYGIIVDLTNFTNAKLQSLDFAHSGWETEYGPYYYNLYVVNMSDSTLLYKADSLFAQDAFDTVKWETGVSLNNVSAQGKIGIFIQPLTGADPTYDAYPSIMTDSTTPPKVNGQVHIWNPLVEGNKLKYTNIYNPRSTMLGDFLINVYVTVPVGDYDKIVKAPIAEDALPGIQSLGNERVKTRRSLAAFLPARNVIPGFIPMANLLGFNVYRGFSPSNMQVIATVPATQLEFVDDNPLVDTNYYYGVSAVYAGNKESFIKIVQHFQPKFVTIAEAVADTNEDFRPDMLGKKVTLTGVVISPNFQGNITRTDIVIQDGNKGITIYKGNQYANYPIGTVVAVTGIIDQYRGKNEIVPGDINNDIIILGQVDPPTPIDVPNLAAVGEEYENVLIRIKNLRFVEPVNWPAVGQSGNVTVTDGTNQLTMRIWAGTPLPGWTDYPKGKFDLVCIGDQFTSSASVYTGGYQVKPRSKDDFKEGREIDTLSFKWARMSKNNTLPKYWTSAGPNYERGFAVGKVNDKYRLYVVSRSGGPKLVVHDALTGDSLTAILPTSTISGGLFPMNDAGVSDDGIIFVNNMTLNADATNPFKVYRYDSESSQPQVVVSLNLNSTSQRMGDMVNYVGKVSDNSFQIWAGINTGSGPAKVVKFTTTDSGKTFAHQIITINGPTSGSNANAWPVTDTTFFYKRYGEKVYYCHVDGTVIDTISTTVVGTGASRIRFFRVEVEQGVYWDILAAYYASANGAEGFERVDFIDVTNGLENAEIIVRTPSLGKLANGNASGDIDIFYQDNMFIIYVLGTNNGIAAFNTNDENLTSPDTLFYGDHPGVLYKVQSGGYVAGTNAYNDLGKYQRFDFAKNDILYGGTIYFKYLRINNTSDPIDLVVRTVNNTTGAPDSLLYKKTIKTSQLDTTAAGTQFWLPEPILLNGPVFIGVEWTLAVDDTFAIVTDINGKGDNAKRAWEKWDNGQYYPIHSSSSFNLDIDLWIAGLYKKAYYPVVSVEELADVLPTFYSLEQNYPNPFNPITTIQFSLRTDAKVTLTVYNILGQKVVTLLDQDMSAGVKKVTFDASKLASGVYMYRLEVKGNDGSKFVDTKKMMLLK